MPEPREAPGMQGGAWTDLPENGPWCCLSTHWAPPGTGKHLGFCVLFCSLFLLQGLWPFEAFLCLVYTCQEIQLVKVFLNLCFIKIPPNIFVRDTAVFQQGFSLVTRWKSYDTLNIDLLFLSLLLFSCLHAQEWGLSFSSPRLFCGLPSWNYGDHQQPIGWLRSHSLHGTPGEHLSSILLLQHSEPIVSKGLLFNT